VSPAEARRPRDEDARAERLPGGVAAPGLKAAPKGRPGEKGEEEEAEGGCSTNCAGAVVGSPAGQKGAPDVHGGAGTPPPARSPPTGAAGRAALPLPGLKRKAVDAPPNGTPGEKYGGVLELETTVGEEVRLGALRPRPSVSAPGENTNSISDVPTRQRSLHGGA